MNDVQDKSEPRSRRVATTARHQDLHDRLLDTAERAVAEDGLVNLRARALAEAVGCSVGAIYGVFADLDALILEVNGRTLDAIGLALQAAGGDGAAERLVRLAHAYLDYAVANRPRGRPITPAYAARQAAAFAHVEGPLAALRPDLPDEARALLARTLFSAVHGMVEIGLDERVASMPLPSLRDQIQVIVEAVADGLRR
jgi:AcrR family transcriptional regulator